MVKYAFTPYLMKDCKFIPVSQNQMTDIVTWYKARMRSVISCEDFSHIQLLNVSSEHDKIIFEINQRIHSIMVESFVDPDDDGNHPITLNQTEYLVIGKNYYEVRD